MRKTLLALIVALLTVTAVSPAHAQRDPFEPAIETGEAATGGEEQQPEADPAPEADPQVGPGVANTGADGRPWVAVAYALIALGAALVVLARLRQSPE